MFTEKCTNANDSNTFNEIKPLIFWEGLPPCGLLLSSVVRYFGDSLVILATKAALPFDDLEKQIGKEIIWLDTPNQIWELRSKFSDRNLIIHTGWNHRGWIKYDRFVKRKNKAKVVVVSDNNFKHNIRQFLGALLFRIYYKAIFDAAFVPGKQGQELMRYFGLTDNQIYTGNYGAYEKLYKRNRNISKRNKEFLFVGQLIKRKSVDVIIDAYKKYRSNGGQWNLRIVGDGPLKEICRGQGIIFEGFKQADDIAEFMNQCTSLILVSKDEHWGTVVCEAAACGAMLITWAGVGSSSDLVITGVNGIELKEITVQSLEQVFFKFESLTQNELRIGSDTSVNIAQCYNSSTYLTAILNMCTDFFGYRPKPIS